MPDLPKRQLGRTGLQVTTLGYGAMELRNRPDRPSSDEDAERVLNAVLDAGVNYVDTSIDYGASEERIGRYLAHRRSEYYLASKCGCAVGDEVGTRAPHVFTAENVIAGVEQSLRRLNTDYLDVVQFHHSPSRAELEEGGGLEALQKLQQQGKVRFIGMSGTMPNLEDQIAMGVFDVFQVPYSALQREHEELIHRASDAGAGMVIRGGVGRGDPARERGTFWDKWQQAEIDDLLDGMSRMDFLLRFTISNPDLDTTIVGTSSAEHLTQNVATLMKGPLPADQYEEAKRRLSASI
jgi:aryl-alcohol dehydrogenase-like predicted oxidoreductase